MPFVPGESLQQRIAREGPLPVDEAVRIARDMALALAYAHARGVVHRDVKPANILLHEGEPILADFGIAYASLSAAAERITASGLVVGTPEYMSPEQASGATEPDGRSDVYSLACVLFEMLTGEPPFTGPTAVSVMTKRLVDPPPSARRLRATIPAGLDEALRCALATAPVDRYATAQAFAEALTVSSGARTASPVVAVLPFRTVGTDPDNELFADGITEDVIIHLSKLRTLDVIARSSAMAFKERTQGMAEIAAALNATALLDGSVRRAGNRVRIVVELVDPRTLQHLWAETYDRELTDIFAIQTDVALRIASALQAELSTDERARIGRGQTSDLRAYGLFLQGRQHVIRFTRSGMLEAVACYERAAEVDPAYARAHAGAAQAWSELGETGGYEPREAFRNAKAAATRALELDPQLADALCVLGHIKGAHEFDWTGAEALFMQALALQPGHADAYDLYGRLCTAQGRYEEGVEMARRAQELDPMAHRSDLISALQRAGRNEEALREAERAVALDPAYDRLRAAYGWALTLMGRPDEGIAQLEKAMQLSPESAQWRAQHAQALAYMGRTDEARAILSELRSPPAGRYVSPYHIAYVHVGLGEHDAAVDSLERAFEAGAGAIYAIKCSFLFRPLRGHPRFEALVRRMNLSGAGAAPTV
jgi:serine/threonine-protein kinase